MTTISTARGALDSNEKPAADTVGTTSALDATAGTTATATTAPAADVTAEAIALAASLPLDEKVALLTGAATWTLREIAEIGMRTMTVSDGPIGVRGTGEDGLPSAQLPAPSATAATWDVDLQERLGTLMAAEARRKGVDVILAPVVNLQRSPVGGRHFECLSEDPLLTARLAVSFVDAIQAQGIAACVKHFVGNETETDRTNYLSRIDEQTLREVYLAPFEAVVDAGVWTIMAAYNGLTRDGVDATSTAHEPLLSGILKGEWQFDGIVISDWLATKTAVEPALAGLDLVMPGPGGPWAEGLLAAVESGLVPEQVIDDKVARIVRLAGRVGALSGIAGDTLPFDPTGATADPAGDEIVALLTDAAARSTVVLRNDADLLPVSEELGGRITLIGHNAVEPFTQGGGSAFVTPPHVSEPLEALRAAFPGATVDLHRGGSTKVGAPLAPAEVLSTPAGGPGVLVEHLDGDGAVIGSHIALDGESLWFPIDGDVVASVRITTDLHLKTAGRHLIDLGPVGAHRVVVDGVERSTSDAVVGAEVILDSSYANPERIETWIETDEPRTVRIEIDAQVVDGESYGHFVRVHFRYLEPGLSIEEEIELAVAAAAGSDLAVVIVGTNPETESEGWDRPTLALPGRQNELVRRVAAVNPRTVVVVNAGAPVILPWLDEVAAVLWWWLPGQEAGASLAAVLTGAIEPSGRLPWTLPAREEDVPVPNGTPVDGLIDYTEGRDVGHRGWDRRGLVPAREFGYGLGYTEWAYRGIELVAAASDEAPDALVIARVTIENAGARDGREVVQVYLSTDDVERPVRWLAGFAVADVTVGATSTIDIPLARRSFETWSTDAAAWTLPAGMYRVQAGRSSRDLRLEAAHAVGG
ncbi:beta-glucosidase [Agromyces salentinus]|uniref:Glycoside hydrolase family 3 C-terminal domain-containing protein n=1 Tax=Agromyces salentinus TaxID=269421 RepID=A0ABN2MHK8_9MICO|nr:glycoside hydrolase family 3 C-terminal domain-containing protein [Agromyces salentinus]